jgi:two-component system, NarL family, nitrate/nitrite response regulator NarL
MKTAPLNPLAPVRIVICDEHPIFRDGLRELLEAVPGHRIVGEIGSEMAAVALVCDLLPDVLLLGAGRSDRFSTEILQQLAAFASKVRTILLTGTAKKQVREQAFQLGVSAVVQKAAAADVLFDTIAAVMAGQQRVYLTATLAPEGARTLESSFPLPNPFGLTERELEILSAVVQGQTNKAIALRCSISENTVKRHLVNIFDKVGASNRVELALFADHHQLMHLL